MSTTPLGATTGDAAGVIGITSSSAGQGVRGGATNVSAVGVLGYNLGGGLAGQFNGPVQIYGNLSVGGTLTANVKNFKIDDPLDPDHKSLYHASIESSEMMDLYSGNVVLDRKGEAVVTMPEWSRPSTPISAISSPPSAVTRAYT